MNKTFIIAEIGNTHEGSLGLAKRFIRAAADCGVDAVKFQTHLFDAESTANAPNPPYFKDETRKEYFERTAFSLSQYRELKRYCEEECQCEFMSSPFSIEAIHLLEQVGVKTYKVPSGEVSNTPFLLELAKTRKRVLLSSGMSSWEELDEAVKTLRDNGCPDLAILQCTSEYPCLPENSGLNLLGELKTRYGCNVGFSDHTLGTSIPVAAVVLGATVVEKHFTLSKLMYGSDAKNSTEPEEFRRLVSDIRSVEVAVNARIDKDVKVGQLREMKYIFEKSIVASRDLPAGHVIAYADMAFKKPGDGMPARKFNTVIGKKLLKNISKDEQITIDKIAG
jgi:N,N'-diacetyllegionaminate synthase